jgi:hypothetical protein
MSSKKNQNTESAEPKSEKKRLTAEQVEKQIETVKKIAELTEQIKNLLPELEGKSANIAYTNSVLNLEKKNELYGKARFLISDEEKELLKKIRKGEVVIKEKKV